MAAPLTKQERDRLLRALGVQQVDWSSAKFEVVSDLAEHAIERLAAGDALVVEDYLSREGPAMYRGAKAIALWEAEVQPRLMIRWDGPDEVWPDTDVSCVPLSVRITASSFEAACVLIRVLH
jgi:hypothetical protein